MGMYILFFAYLINNVLIVYKYYKRYKMEDES